MQYDPHESLVAPARARPELWRLGVAIVIVGVFYTTLLITYLLLADALLPPSDRLIAREDSWAELNTPLSMIAVLLSFTTMTAATLIAARKMHRRGMMSMIGAPKPALRDFWRTLRALIVLNAVLWVLIPDDTEIIANLPFSIWLGWLPLGLLALLIQIGSEELLFRGYLQQQMAARFSTPLIWMVVPSVVFGALHYDPLYGQANAMVMAVGAGVFGLAAADLTARTGTLGPALALHFFNNFMAMFVVSLSGEMSGLALYTYPFDASSPLIVSEFPVELAWILVSWLAARVALRV